MTERTKERDMERVLRKHFMVFQSAWFDYLKALEKREFFFPTNEEELRCHLFAKCLETMRQKKFGKPYEIFVEDKEIVKGTIADLALGWLEKQDRKFVAVEVKHGPDVEKIKEDIKKLQGYVKSGVFFGFFAMIGNSKYEYRTKVNLKELGIQQEVPEEDGGGYDGFQAWKRKIFLSMEKSKTEIPRTSLRDANSGLRVLTNCAKI